ncbi:MAG TPA: amidohydrolase family protein [Thermoanaerobaculia bacterium]
MIRNALVVVMLVAASAAAGETRRYSVTPRGSMVARVDGDRVSVELEKPGVFLKSELRLGANGFPVGIGIAGSVRGETADERFEQQPADGFYISRFGTPEEMAMIARLALREPAQTLRLLPHGQARAVVFDEARLGQRTATLFGLFGLMAEPVFIWLDEDHNLLAAIEWDATTVRAGAEAHVALLSERQKAVRARWRAELVARLAHKSKTLAVTNARLFDPVSGRITDGTTIVVEGNRITAVGPSVAIPEGAERIDAGGRVVLPGLWDMHRHVWEDDLLFDLAGGVTTIREVGSDARSALTQQRDVEAGKRIGPRMIVSGFLNGVGSDNVRVTTAEEARARIDSYVEAGVDHIKFYGSLDPALVDDVTEYAHAKGLRVSGHIPAHSIASQAIANGLDEIHHMNQVMLNFMPDVKRTDTELRFSAVGERGGKLDLRSKAVRAFVADLRKRGTVIDATIGVLERMFASRSGPLPPIATLAKSRMPTRYYRLQEGRAKVSLTKEEEPRYHAAYRRMLDLLGALHRAGVRIVAGTDGPAGAGLHRELELYVEAGMSPVDALRSATIVPAQYMRRNDLGRVAPGMLADFILVEGDPTKNISDIRRVRTVVKDGAVYDPAAIYREMSVVD